MCLCREGLSGWIVRTRMRGGGICIVRIVVYAESGVEELSSKYYWPQ